MSLGRSRTFLLQADRPEGDPVSLAGLSAKSFSLSTAPYELLDFSPRRWQALKPGSGRLSMRLSGQGLFVDKAGETLVLSHFLNGEALSLHIIVPDFGTFSGAFLTTQVTLQARPDDVMSWRLALQSAGDIDFEMA